MQFRCNVKSTESQQKVAQMSMGPVLFASLSEVNSDHECDFHGSADDTEL